MRRQPRAPDGFARMVDDLRMVIELLAHVAVLLLDADVDARAGKARGRLVGELRQHVFLVAQPRGDEVADDQSDRGASTSASRSSTATCARSSITILKSSTMRAKPSGARG